MASNSILKLKAKAIVAVRKRKLAKELEEGIKQASESALENRLVATLTQHITSLEKARDKPVTASDVLSLIDLPAPQIHHTENTIVQKVDPTLTDEGKLNMEVFIRGILPEILPEDKPAVEQITIDESDEKLEGFVSKEEMKKHLRKIQRAILEQSGGGGGAAGDLVHVITVSVDTIIKQAQLLSDRYNVILVQKENITITLPADTGTKIIEIKQGFVGTGTYTVCKA